MSEGAFGFFVVVAIGLGIAAFKAPKEMYWIGLVALHFQALFFVFQLPKIVQITKEWNTKNQAQPSLDQPVVVQPQEVWTDGQKVALCAAMAPFLLPLIAAGLTGAVSASPVLGVASFTLWSLVQVVIHGQISEQNVGQKIGPIVKFAIPIVGLLINLMRAYSEWSGKI